MPLLFHIAVLHNPAVTGLKPRDVFPGPYESIMVFDLIPVTVVHRS
jgi:hypothetical protein